MDAVSPETREWPRPYRILAKLLLGFVYAWATVAGGHVMFPLGQTPFWPNIVLGGMAVLFGTVCLIAVGPEWWLVERAAVIMVCCAFACYAAVDSVRLVLGTGGDLGGTGALWISAGAFGWRLLVLTVDARRREQLPAMLVRIRQARA